MGNVITNDNFLCNCSVARKKTVFQVSAGTWAICLEEQIRERVILFLFCLVAAESLPRSLR
jgi:hypothetical protein